MAYTTTSNKLKITELDFDNIKTALKTYLQGQDEFKDYNFEGSALNILLDVLSYNTHYNGFYTNMLASEMFMDSAALRSSVVSLGKQLGYTPASRSGAFINVDVTFTDVSDSPTNIVINRATKFVSKINSQSYTFLNSASAIATVQGDGSYKATNVEIREGVYFTNSYTVAGTENELFEIPSELVDINTLLVTKGGEICQKADDITSVETNSKIYFLQEGRNGFYEIYFGDGVIGKKAEAGETVEIAYFASFLGEEGNGASAFAAAQTIQNAAYTITVTPSSGYTRTSGGERETVQSIRIQAPNQYALQKRVVTADDYRSRLVNEYNLVDSVRVWGGEDNDPPEYGKVFISIKPKTGFVLSDSERKNIIDNILKKRNVVTISPVVVDPEYMYLVLGCLVSHDPRKTGRTTDQVSTIVKETVESYSSNSLDKFDDYFRNSVLTRQIDSADISITNSLIDVKVKKSFQPPTGVVRTYKLDFNNALYHPHSGHHSILSSSKFTYGEHTECSLFDADGVVFVGKESGANIREVGTIEYDTGKITLNNIRIDGIDDGSSFVYVTAKPQTNDIVPMGNTILTIDINDVTITMVDDTETIKSKSVQGY